MTTVSQLRNERKAKRLFLVALVIYIVATFMMQTRFREEIPHFQLAGQLVVCFSGGLLFIKQFMEYRFAYQHYMMFILSLMLGGTIAILTTNILLPVTLCLFVYSSRNVDFGKIIEISFFTLLSCMLLIQVLYAGGLLRGGDDIRPDGAIRYALGYRFVTFAANYYFHLVVMLLFTKKNELSLWVLVLLMLGNIYFFAMTDTKSAFAFTCLAILWGMVAKFVPNNNVKMRTLLNRYVVSFGVVLSLVSVLVYSLGIPGMDKFNRLLTDRLSLAEQAIEVFGFSLLGQPVEWIFYGDGPKLVQGNIITSYLYVDSSFVNMAINYGILPLLLILFGYYCVAHKKFIATDRYFTIALTLIALHSVFDPQFLEIQYNPFLLALGALFYQRTRWCDFLIIRKKFVRS
ncbi:MAG: hypothetical protein Q4A10_03715 [Aerococcaceae bacterium]|nr:hypothetical protein [Aerococcaceae bacterium]